MKYFEILYISGGEKRKIILDSNHKIEAIKNFENKTLGMLISIKEINEPITDKIKSLINFKIERKIKIELEAYIIVLRQLAVLLDAGIALNFALEESVKSTDNKQLKKIFNDILSSIESGSNLSDAFKKFSYELGYVSYAIIHLGEQTGSLSEAVGKLSDILEEVHENKKRLKKAVRYPIMVISAMAVAFIIVITFVVPQFEDMYSEYNGELPIPTQILLGLESFISSSWYYGLAGIVISFIATKYYYRNNIKFREFFDKYILKIYLIGKVMHLSMIGRYVYIFDKLTNSGVPVLDALQTANNVIENSYIKNRLKMIKEAVEDGKTLTQGFVESKMFDSMAIQMINGGESSGMMNRMLGKIDGYYRNKYLSIVDNISAYIEPVLILVLACLMLLLALGIFLPIWSLAENMGA